MSPLGGPPHSTRRCESSSERGAVARRAHPHCPTRPAPPRSPGPCARKPRARRTATRSTRDLRAPAAQRPPRDAAPSRRVAGPAHAGPGGADDSRPPSIAARPSLPRLRTRRLPYPADAPRRSPFPEARPAPRPPKTGESFRGIGIPGTTMPLWWKRSCQGTPEWVRSGCWFRATAVRRPISSSAAGDAGVARTGSGITRATQPFAARGETSGPCPARQPRCRRRFWHCKPGCPAEIVYRSFACQPRVSAKRG